LSSVVFIPFDSKDSSCVSVMSFSVSY
jgi:hypothetical protein